mgnify:FL=1|jgi:hypothetical protein
MLGKAIFLIILAMLIWAGYIKLARKLGVQGRKKTAAAPSEQKPILTKFNLIIAGLIAVYLMWGLVQILG